MQFCIRSIMILGSLMFAVGASAQPIAPQTTQTVIKAADQAEPAAPAAPQVALPPVAPSPTGESSQKTPTENTQAKPSAEGQAQQQAEDAAVSTAIAQEWIALIDAGQHPEAWTKAAELLQQNISQEEWAEVMRKAREPLGALQSRTFHKNVLTGELEGFPDGTYRLIEYKSAYENAPVVSEMLVAIQTKEREWRVATYLVRAPQPPASSSEESASSSEEKKEP